jgi:hypothetical protein
VRRVSSEFECGIAHAISLGHFPSLGDYEVQYALNGWKW